LIEFIERAGEIVFKVRVIPRAARDAIQGVHAGALKVRLTAPPSGGKANESLRRLLAGRLNVPVSAVKIIAGETSRTKRLAISGVTAAQMHALIEI
jgi:uncharacterized protein (TIGR00251 family)